MNDFLQTWNTSALTTLGLFWMAFWAFGLGYFISSCIQVFITRQRMKEMMGETGPRSVALGTFFGFISSSCSFAALATTRSFFTKGAGLIPSLAFLLASTNLVIELGIIIAVFLSWQFVLGEYLGGIILILLMWLIVKWTLPQKLEADAREYARRQTGDHQEEKSPEWKTLIRSREGWRRVANRYVMEWHMVWKDVTIGFTVAGIIAAFVPREFFQTLFIGSNSANPSFFEILAQTLIGPVAAFFTFIGSMGNIPLAAVLYGNGLSFAGIIAFIFSDLVVFPVLRIQAKYYGWKMALYITGIFLIVLVITALLMHYGLAVWGLLPEPGIVQQVTQREFFKLDYTFFLNSLFILLSAAFLIWKIHASGWKMGHMSSERILFILALVALTWLGGGLIVPSLLMI